MNKPSERRFGRIRIFAKILLLTVGLLAAVLAAEFAFRLGPPLLPAGSYGASRYDADLRTNVHKTDHIYNKVRFTRRVPNSDGFLDVEHPLKTPNDVVRIGFFGDSFVEAAQVQLEEVFFRRLEEQLGAGYEALGFGISGWGTYNAMQAWRVFGRRYDVDQVVYLFVENDLGDQLMAVANPSGGLIFSRPLVEPSANPSGYEVQWPEAPTKESLSRRFGKFLQHHSLLAHVVRTRLTAIARGGVSIGVRKEDVEMSGRAGKVPKSRDLVSSWPTEYADAAREVGAAVLRDWAQQVAAEGKEFWVLYVPRGNTQLQGEIAQKDIWLPWLRRTCSELEINLLDPTDSLRQCLEDGSAAYADHWSPAGHQVIADFLAISPAVKEPKPQVAP